MLELYTEVRFVHISCVLMSGMLFACRGVLMLTQSAYTNHPVLRFTSYGIDTVLLIAGLWLIVITQQYPWAQPWLSVKLVLLLLYIALGLYALKRGRNRHTRTYCFVAALATYLLMISVAIQHHPLGIFSRLGL